MENNLKNKVKYFSQYWGNVDVVERHGNKFSVHMALDELNIEDAYLVLKPISAITDLEMIEYYNLLFSNDRADIEKIQSIKYDIVRGKMFNQLLTISKCIISIDYLRSKNYAVPFFDLSIADLVSYGWVVLR